MLAEVHVYSPEVELEKIAQATRSLLAEIRQDVDSGAHQIIDQAASDAKGEMITVGQIALALVTTGALSAMTQSLLNFLARNRKFYVELQNADGQKMIVNAEFISGRDLSNLESLLERFFDVRSE